MWGGPCLAPNWVPMLKERIGDRTVNSVFRVSVKTILSAGSSDKQPLITALLILTTLNNECFFHYDLTT